MNDDYKEFRQRMRGEFTKDDDKNATEDETKRAKAADKAFHACRSKLRNTSDAAPREALAKMGELKDKMCACQDKACADKVVDETTRWSTELARTADRTARATEEDTKKGQALIDEYTACATKAMSH